MSKRNNAKSLIMQSMFRTRIVRDKTKYRRKDKHRNATKPGADNR